MTIASTRLVPIAALALAGCGEPEQQVAVTDESGGEFTVATPTPGAVPVDVPTTDMTMSPGPYDTATPPATATPAGTPIAPAAPE